MDQDDKNKSEELLSISCFTNMFTVYFIIGSVQLNMPIWEHPVWIHKAWRQISVHVSGVEIESDVELKLLVDRPSHM